MNALEAAREEAIMAMSWVARDIRRDAKRFGVEAINMDYLPLHPLKDVDAEHCSALLATSTGSLARDELASMLVRQGDRPAWVTREEVTALLRRHGLLSK